MATPALKPGAKMFDLRTVPPLKEYQFAVDRFTKGITDWRPALHLCGDVFKGQMRSQFNTQGRETGPEWAALSPEYKAWKTAHYPGNGIGVLTGALRMAMTGGGGYSEFVTHTTGSFGMSGSSKAAPYGGYFSFGTSRMPARPVIRPTAAQGREYQKAVHGWLVSEAHHAGLTGTLSSVANAPLPDTDYTQALSAL